MHIPPPSRQFVKPRHSGVSSLKCLNCKMFVTVNNVRSHPSCKKNALLVQTYQEGIFANNFNCRVESCYNLKAALESVVTVMCAFPSDTTMSN